MTTIDLTRTLTDRLLIDLATHLVDKANRLADEMLTEEDPAIGWQLLHQLDEVLADHRLVLAMLDTETP